VTRFARIFLVLYLGGIVYLSLYPWDFLPRPRSMELSRIPLFNRRLVLDAVVNVLFYVPLGAAAFASLRRGWRAWAGAIVCGSAVSYALETAQLYTPSRAATLRDWQANTLGAALGAALGHMLTSPRWRERVAAWAGRTEWRLTRMGAAFLILWILWQAFPFIPYLGWYRVRLTLARLPELPWSWLAFAQNGVGFFVLRRVLGPSRWTLLAFALLPAQLFLSDRNLSPPVVLGAALGWIASRCVARDRAHGWIAAALVAWLAFEEFRPFRLLETPQPFNWSPVESWYQTGFAAYYATVFRKTFLYASVVWSLRAAELRWIWAVAVPAVVLAAGEWTQRYLQGRTPETADLALLAAAAAMLAGTSRRPAE
jgi:VanZ family protein